MLSLKTGQSDFLKLTNCFKVELIDSLSFVQYSIGGLPNPAASLTGLNMVVLITSALYFLNHTKKDASPQLSSR